MSQLSLRTNLVPPLRWSRLSNALLRSFPYNRQSSSTVLDVKSLIKSMGWTADMPRMIMIGTSLCRGSRRFVLLWIFLCLFACLLDLSSSVVVVDGWIRLNLPRFWMPIFYLFLPICMFVRVYGESLSSKVATTCLSLTFSHTQGQRRCGLSLSLSFFSFFQYQR